MAGDLYRVPLGVGVRPRWRVGERFKVLTTGLDEGYDYRVVEVHDDHLVVRLEPKHQRRGRLRRSPLAEA